MFNEALILQIFLILVILFFTLTFNMLTIWYLAGLYLLLLGWLLFLEDGDIFVGFLWVIDLGVGLIFFIFILHYSTFLHQKSNLVKTSREFTFAALSIFSLITLTTFLHTPIAVHTSSALSTSWVFSVSWYDYYDFYATTTVTDLNLLHEIYFTNNSFEFFLINFFLLYGIISSILLSFLVKRIFNFLSYSQFTDSRFLNLARSTYLIRNQDYLKQQRTSAGVRIWNKKKHHKV